ncbi:putative small lipoprotein YifL [Lysobacter enzymogenes]|uniref:LPS translocon maturation chaperone LptM n=1 Tax=Lysobacter enzymogenes TaxID=69 RepID=UPI0008945339|nr:lipoprotein [Lysobacter enzymogenes]SDW12989.1 lipoprotein-attachment site-containing protein [Lysobacter enzymogenes]
MNARPASFLIPVALTLALAACGNKGPLVLPTAPPPPEAPKAKPGEVPVTISNANAPPVATDPHKKSQAVPSLDKVLAPPAEGADKDKAEKDKAGKDKSGQDSSDGADKPAEPVPASGQGDG